MILICLTDIALLHQICVVANEQDAPPFKALFAAYDRVFQEQVIEQEHDGIVFRLLLRVGEIARKGGGQSGRVDLVGCLKELLAAQGITVIADDEVLDGEGDESRNVVVNGGHVQLLGIPGRADGSLGNRPKKTGPDRRRVSFDDARLEETWLSDRSRDVTAARWQQDQSQQNTLLSQPPRRGRQTELQAPRARSASSQRPQGNGLIHQSAAPKHYQRASPSTTYASEAEFDYANPTLLFQPSQTQLEQNASAFFSTSSIRIGRRCLHVWHDTAIELRQTRRQAYAIANAHDQRTLLKQAFDEWRGNLAARKATQRESNYWHNEEYRADNYYHNKILWRAFTHWVTSTNDQQAAVEFAKRRILRLRYFYRWRTIAVGNAAKARRILARKYLEVWRERLVRRRVREEQALAIHEERCVKLCWRAWFWQFCSRRVDAWRDDKIKRGILLRLAQRSRELREREALARDVCYAHAGRHAIYFFRQRLLACQYNQQVAHDHHRRIVSLRCLHRLLVQAKLSPNSQLLKLKIQLDLQRKAFKVWRLHLRLTREAVEVDRKRILQSAWTSWNDALRCKALSQRIDERVLIESLYRWVLQERLRLFRRKVEDGIARQTILLWHDRIVRIRQSTVDGECALVEFQQRRLLSLSMQKLHIGVRRHEDAERAALEFANTHSLLPYSLQILVEKTRHAQELNKWANDARFYTLTTRALTAWKEKTTEHQHTRRRLAYRIIRSRVKTRMTTQCLKCWRSKVFEFREMNNKAVRQAQARLFRIGTQAFDRWHEKTSVLAGLDNQATELDQQRLLSSALQAVQQRLAYDRALKGRAVAFRRDTDLAIMSTALKRVQWAQFTAARRTESAEALWARNRDNHIRQIIRHWITLTTARRDQQRQAGAAVDEEVEPESPSLRPASRLASRSRERYGVGSSPSANSATPAYLRTPSRSRRAGRFRPIPMPAPMTPFAFDPSYLATTPAPVPDSGLDLLITTSDLGGDINALTPQVTPFARKLRAGGFQSGASTPGPSVLRSSAYNRSVHVGGTAKSVRFAGASRFGRRGSDGHLKSS